MLKHAADQVDTICACLQEERVSGSVINEFRNSLKDSDLAIDEKHLKELGAARFQECRQSARNFAHSTNPWQQQIVLFVSYLSAKIVCLPHLVRASRQD